MKNSPGTFERLVLTLESAERQDMLKQLAEITELQEDESRSARAPALAGSSGVVSPEQNLLGEPFIIRLWFIILAFLTSNSPGRLYSRHLVSELGRTLGRKYGQYISIPVASYTDDFYQQLLRLKTTQNFFSSLLNSYESDKGGFYIVLGSLLMKRTCKSIIETTDPFTVPYDRAPNRDIRLGLLREMDTLFLAIPDDERGRMYQAVQSIEWIKMFCTVPLDRMILRFGSMGGVGQGCLIDTLTEEMKYLANNLCSAKRIPILLMEALFLFSMKDQLDEGKFDLEHECAAFVTTAAGHLEVIRQFKSLVPVGDFVRYSTRDISWEPMPSEAGEDWFILFKNAWKKRFDEKWNEWNRLHRRAMLEQSICRMLYADRLPALQYHPWEGMWMPLSLRRELSLTILKGFFSAVYPTRVMKTLKILLIDGDFYRRENLIEYTDAFSTLEHQQQIIELFENRLSPKGDIGEGFTLLLNEKIATVKGKARLENLMLSTDAEVELIISRTLTAIRSIDSVLGGILNVIRGGPYETLINLSSIQGKLNEKFRKDLALVRQILQDVSAIISEAEVIEKESL